MKLVNVESPEKYVCKMTFSATAEELETASQAVYERTRSTYTIKGFAKGEADRAQIEADRGEHTFWYDAINDLMDQDVPALYEAALKENGFVPVEEPAYDLVSVKKDEGFVATALVVLQPELTIPQITGFRTVCRPAPTSDREVEQTIERTRQQSALLVPHKGPAVKGNIVHLDYTGYLDDKPFPGGKGENQAVELGSGRMIPGFEEGILGHRAGEEFEIHVTFPERYQAPNLAGKPAVFQAKLLDVCVRQFPAMNSDFAKRNGYDTMEAFRAGVRAEIEKRKHTTAMNRAKDELLNMMGAQVEGELPALLLETAFQNEITRVQQQLQMQGTTLDRYLAQLGQPREEFDGTIRRHTTNNVRTRLALLQIAHEQGLEPTEAEVDIELSVRAERGRTTVEKLLARTSYDAVRRDLTARKAADYIVANSTIDEQ